MTETKCGEKLVAADEGRRNVALALFGALGGAAFMEACAAEQAGVEGAVGQVSQAVLGTVAVKVVDTILGAAPPAARTGDLNKTPAQLDATNPPAVVVAKRCVTAYDGGGGAFMWNATGRVGDFAGGLPLIDDGGTIIVPGGAFLTSATATGCWQRIYSGPIDVRWFGASADWNGLTDFNCAGTDNHTAVQQALDVLNSAGGGDLLIPDGKYLFKTGLKVYSHTRVTVAAGAWLGITSVAGLHASAFGPPINHNRRPYAEGCLFNLAGNAGGQYYCVAPVLLILGRFYSDAGSNLGLVYADPVDAPDVVGARLESRWLYSSAGYLLYDTYVQQSSIRFGRSEGIMDRAMELVGNIVSIHGVDVEAVGGGAAGYLIKLGRSGVKAGANIRLYDTVIECTVPATTSNVPAKRHLLVQNTQDVLIDNYWAESTNMDPQLWTLDNAQRTHVTGSISALGPGATVNLANQSSLFFADQLFTAGRGIDGAIVCDASSFFSVWSCWNGNGDNAIVLPDYDYKLSTEARYNRAIAEPGGAYPNYAVRSTQQNLQGENLFQNPNFLAGDLGWTFGGSASYSRSYVRAGFGAGQACKLTFSSGNYATVTQPITLVAGNDGSGIAKYAGQALTVAMRVRFISGNTTEWASPFFQSSNPSITQSFAIARSYSGVGAEQVVTQTVLIPANTPGGTVIDVGVSVSNVTASTQVVIGKGLCIIGGQGVIAAGAQQMIDLGPLPIFTSSAIPTSTAGMPKGALAFNSNPGTTDTILGWRFNGSSWQTMHVTLS